MSIPAGGNVDKKPLTTCGAVLFLWPEITNAFIPRDRTPRRKRQREGQHPRAAISASGALLGILSLHWVSAVPPGTFVP